VGLLSRKSEIVLSQRKTRNVLNVKNLKGCSTVFENHQKNNYTVVCVCVIGNHIEIPQDHFNRKYTLQQKSPIFSKIIYYFAIGEKIQQVFHLLDLLSFLLLLEIWLEVGP